MKKLAILAVLLLAGCSGEVIYLRNADGQAAACGPYNSYTASSEVVAAQQLRDCVSDFQRQGYQRVAAPAK